MTDLLITFENWWDAPGGPSTALLVKATVLLTAISIGLLVIGSRHVLVRSAFGNASLAALLLLPLAEWLLPRVEVACLPTPVAHAYSAQLERPVPTAIDNGYLAVPATGADLAPPQVHSEAHEDSARPVFEATPIVSAPAVPFQPAPVTNSAPLQWRAVAWQVARAIYLAGVVTALLRLTVGMIAVLRLLRSATAVVDQDWTGALTAWREKLRLRRAVNLLQSPGVRVPVLLGYWRPTIVVPSSTVGAGNALRDAVLVHELAHVRRGDDCWHFVGRLVAALYWFHPLAWFVVGRHEQDREEACDAWCAWHLSGGSAAYAAALVEMARQLVRRPGVLIGIAMAGPRRLKQRLERVAASAGSSAVQPSLKVRGGLVAGLAGVALGLASLEIVAAPAAPPDTASKTSDIRQQQEPAAPKPADSKGNLEVLVREGGTQRPLAGAIIRVRRDGEESLQTTESQGRALIARSRFEPERLEIYVLADGFVPQRFAWGENIEGWSTEPRPETTMPQLQVIDLLPAMTIGGVVQDEDGRPIANATVFLCSNGYECRVLSEKFYDVRVTSDSQGRWRNANVPPSAELIRTRLEHPAHVGDWQYREGDSPPIEAFVRGTAVLTMEKGKTVRGRVRDGHGRPIPNARVALIAFDDGPIPHDRLSVRTDPDGRFTLINAPAGPGQIVVQAASHAPELVRFVADESGASVDVLLGEARRIAGQVVDPTGNPVAGAEVVTGHWRGPGNLHWHTFTDTAGRFSWDAAPRDAFQLKVAKRRFADMRLVVKENESDVRVCLRPIVNVRGTVKDASTGRSIPGFSTNVCYVYTELPREQELAIGPGIKSATEGTLELLLAEGRPAVITIRARGYLPWSQMIRCDRPGEFLDAKLRPEGQWWSCVLRQPDGQPAAGGQIAACSPRTPLSLTRMSLTPRSHDKYPRTRSDSEGKFALPPIEEYFVLVAIHDAGYFEDLAGRLARSGEIGLKPWGRIEGTDKPAGAPAAGQTIGIVSYHLFRGQWVIYAHDETQSDDNGRFVFDRVLPGEIEIYRTVTGPTGRVRALLDRRTVESGKTVRVAFGGMGRRVVGRLSLPADLKGRASFTVVGLRLLCDPDDTDAVDSSRGLARPDPRFPPRPSRRPWYELEVAADGTFRIEEVPPGDYRLYVTLGSPEDPRSVHEQPAARLNQRVRIPDRPAGRPDEPFDLGTLLMNASEER